MTTRETFGEIITRLLPENVTLAQLQRDAEVSYPHLHSLVKGVRDGKPARPSPDLVLRLIDVLCEYGANVQPSDEAALMQTAANLPEGYVVVREQSQSQRQSSMVREHPIYNYLDGQPSLRLDTADRIIKAAFGDAEDAIQQQTTDSPPKQTTDSPSLVTPREMRMHAARLTRETRARDPRVARAEAVIWTVDIDGRFLLSEGEGLRQAAISPGQVVGLRIWDVYKDETDFLEKVRMVLASDGPLEWTTTVRGTPWRCMTEPLRDAQGVKVGIVGTSLAVPTVSESQKQG